MKTEDIVTEILNIACKKYDDKLSPRSGILVGEVIEALILSDSMQSAAIIFDKTDSAFENLIRRNLRKVFPGKISTESWDNYLLSLINTRKCSCCKEVKGTSLFYKNIDTKSSRCKDCCDKTTVTNRPKYIDGNRLRSKKHYLNNKHDYILKASKRRRLLYTAMPLWADLGKLKEIYKNCPEGYHVDHVIPLQGDLVCGLHVETNLQYLTVSENLKKSNKFTVD